MNHERLLKINRQLAFDLVREYPSIPYRLAAFVADYRRWRLRRSESIELLGSSLIRRSIAIEFLMPEADVSILSGLLVGDVNGNTPQLAIPLATLEKRSLTGFSLRDDTGRDLPHLLAGENGVLSALLLLGLCSFELNLEAGQVEELLDLSLAVTFAPPRDGRGRPEADKLVKAAQLAGSIDRSLVRYFASSLQTGFILYAVMEATGSSRRIVHFDYLDSLKSQSLNWWESLRAGARHPGVAEYELLLPAAADALSFHVNIQVPHSVAITNTKVEAVSDGGESGLRGQGVDREADESGQDSGDRSEPEFEAVTNEHTAYVHLERFPIGQAGRLLFTVKLQRFTGPPLAALYSAVILFVASLTVLATPRPSLVSQDSLWVPILLVVPAGYALFVGDGGEPHLLTRILRPFRDVGITASIALVLLAFSILFQGDRYVHYMSGLGLVVSLAVFGYLRYWYRRRS